MNAIEIVAWILVGLASGFLLAGCYIAVLIHQEEKAAASKREEE